MVEYTKSKKSVWASQALENAEEGPAPAAIDWDMIRKQKDEFAKLKWRGESQEPISCRNTPLLSVDVSLDCYYSGPNNNNNNNINTFLNK